MVKGGYQVIGFDNIGEDPVTIKGAFKKAKSKKAILCENVEGMTFFSFDCTPTVTTTATLPLTVIADQTVTSVYITITNEDVVSLNIVE